MEFLHCIFEMMKLATTTCFLLLLPCLLLGQNVPESRQTSYANITGEIPNLIGKTVVNLKELGADVEGVHNADQVMKQAIAKLGREGGIIYLPSGSYLFNQTIELSSNIYVVGDGANKSKVVLDLQGAGHGIQAIGKVSSGWQAVGQTSIIGSQQLVVPSHAFKKGDLIRIRINDEGLITSSWAKGSVGQITEITEVNGSKLVLRDALRIEVGPDNKAEVAQIEPVSHCGVANISLTRKDATTAQTDNIRFEYTHNAMVYGVASRMCNFSHVNNVFSYRNIIFGSTFSDAFSHGSGGKGYGVVLSFTSGNCALENNIFDRLRHSVLFQAGPNGNVVAYNYSKNPHWTGVAFPSDFAGDIVMHGNYPFRNLIEGNICQNMVIDNSHGINGPDNVFLRNRVENAGIFMNTDPASDRQIFIGNEVTGTGTSSNGFFSFPKGLYTLSGKDHFAFSNNINGTLLPNQDAVTIHSLLYSQDLPDYLKFNRWPAIGYPHTFNTGSLPAVERSKISKQTVDLPFLSSSSAIWNFTAKGSNENVILQWYVAGSSTSTRVELFRITNQTETRLTEVNCQTSMINNFSHVDDQYQAGNQDLEYYLVLTDQQGQKKYSDTLQVVSNRGSLSAAEMFSKTNQELVSIDLLDANGRSIEHSKDGGYLSPGIYYARKVYSNGYSEVAKTFIAGR